MEHRKLLQGQIAVEKYYLLPTPPKGMPKQWIYSAWQRTDEPFDGQYSTITTIDGKWHGKIGSDPEREKFDHLPVGQERFDAVRDAYRYRALIAEQYIHDAYPETQGHSAGEFGEIEIVA